MRDTHAARLSDSRARLRDHPTGIRRAYRMREGLTAAQNQAPAGGAARPVLHQPRALQLAPDRCIRDMMDVGVFVGSARAYPGGKLQIGKPGERTPTGKQSNDCRRI